MLGLKIEVKVNGFDLLVERTNLATDFMHVNGYFDQTRFPVGAISPTTLARIGGPHFSYEKPRLVNTSDV